MAVTFELNWLDTAEESPPLNPFPQVTTEPSYLRAANASRFEKIAVTFELKLLATLV